MVVRKNAGRAMGWAELRRMVVSSLPKLALVAGFVVIMYWFATTNFYNKHFFEIGTMVLVYNAFRLCFLCYLIWIICAPGILLWRYTMPASMESLLPIEHGVVAFGVGFGLWQIVLFVLGLLNWYYQPVLMVLCTLAIALSVNDFSALLTRLTGGLANLRASSRVDFRYIGISTAAVGIAAAWLVLVRGLYPGGSGDYYTHYFPYYQAVAANHGLQPNDVWYHYYYSKGAGLFFLSMLLTDAIGPELVTLSCVLVAVLALAVLVHRITPGSAWPAACSVLYLLFYLIEYKRLGGDFQKLHEVSSSLIILVIWGTCYYQRSPDQWEKPFLVFGTSIAIGVVLWSQPVAALLAPLFFLSGLLALFRGNSRQARVYAILTAVTIITGGGVLLLNYWVTGLATDQALDVGWKFANLERLHDWGVLPHLLATAWIRDNYLLVDPAIGWNNALEFLGKCLRVHAFPLLLGSAVLALAFSVLSDRLRSSGATPARVPAGAVARQTLGTVGLTTLLFAVLTLIVGRTQPVSFFRFSTFYFPLLVLFVAASWGVLLAGWRHPASNWVVRVAAPVTLTGLTIILWGNWFGKVAVSSDHAWRFFSGQYSMADAHRNQDKGLPFGGINPDALSAMRQVAPGTRIWSTNVDSYCMVPGCRIESVISYKMSNHYNEVLNGSPDVARQILQSEDLNYFLFAKDSPLLDLLPYSRLFDPTTISNNLAIKWTDGNAFLLTWPGPDTTPISADFLASYATQLAKPELPWFRFSKLVPEMGEAMKAITSSPHPWKPIAFPWRRGVQVLTATYGDSCKGFKPTSPVKNGVFTGNVTSKVKMHCAGKRLCEFRVDAAQLGDPAPQCAKDFTVAYRCPGADETKVVSLASEADGQSALLVCPETTVESK